MTQIKRLVMFSGGLCSWLEGRRVVEKYGADGVALLFADTRMEDATLYTFLDSAAENIGAPLIKIADGRTPWELMRDQGMLARSGADLCSATLKRDLLNKWRKENCDSDVTVTHFGLTHYEKHRLERVQIRTAPWKCEALMTEPPHLQKEDMMELALSFGLPLPRLYTLGFPHNNCKGFCVKAGIANLKWLYTKLPCVYREMEEEEQKTISAVNERHGGKKHYIFSIQRSGGTIPVTLQSLRIQWESQPTLFDDDFTTGGCGCAVDD